MTSPVQTEGFEPPLMILLNFDDDNDDDNDKDKDSSDLEGIIHQCSSQQVYDRFQVIISPIKATTSITLSKYKRNVE